MNQIINRQYSDRKGNIKFEEIGNYKFIENSIGYYATDNGLFYRLCKNGLLKEIKSHINKHNGYRYVELHFNGEKRKTFRAHRVIAKCFVENNDPEINIIVGHKNNIKDDIRASNLYWTTGKENTQKAVDDGLIINDIGIEDSQSMPLACYNNNHELIGVYGSISEADRCIDGFTKSTISKILDKTTKGRKGYYFKSITTKEYYNFPPEYKQKTFVTKRIDKIMTQIKVTKGNYSQIFKNQKDVERHLGIKQANISHHLRNGKEMNGYKFERVETFSNDYRKLHTEN